MKRFQIITEADARVIEYGSTVMLVAGGHVTPLAADTLKARRVSVIRETGDSDHASLAPRADIRTVAIAESKPLQQEIERTLVANRNVCRIRCRRHLP